MKKIYLIIMLFVATGIYAQNNFYSGLETFYQTHPKPDGDPEETESSEYNEMKRIEMIWGPRLFAHGGDESVAAAAMIDYAENYDPIMSTLNPEWSNIGPDKTIPGNWHVGVGRIERICFDPQYNGTSNQTLYATSSFGGLWRTENDGEIWTPLTDYLPFTANADVAISYQNSNNIFLATGYADGRFEYDNDFNHVSALHTFGMYRSMDYGANWEPINNGYIEEFETGGGTARRLIVNPEDESQLFVATSRGVYRCSNALDTEPSWQKVINISYPALNDFRGLAFMPGNPNTLYASGTEIYKSTDGGQNFSPLPINLLPGDYEIHQINIATTPAEPDRLYAYIVGKAESDNKNRIFIFIYSNIADEWVQIYTDESGGILTAMGKGRLALAVSPVNPNQFYFGFTIVSGTPDYTTANIKDQSDYNHNNCHADIHSLAFQPNVQNPALFAGTDGGVGRKDDLINNNNIYGWTALYNGLSVNTIWGFDDSDYDDKKIIIGNQDCGTNKVVDFINKDWSNIQGGDGYGIQSDNSGINRWFIKSGSNYRRYNYTNFPSPDEIIPNICPDDHPNVTFAMKLPMYNHPHTNDVYMGFEEVFRRLKPEPEGNNWEDLWIEESDLFNSGLPLWKRGIMEVRIAESNPDYMYLITTGVQFEPFGNVITPTHLLKSTTGGINGDCNNTAFSIVEYPGYNPDPQTFFPIVSNLTVDPNNENRFWITYTGFVPEYKVYRTDDGGATWENEDPNGTLANIPVNNIIYQYGSNDRLFIGTDAGVYIKDGPDADWEKFGNIPNVRVNRLKINYCANLLRAGTFGRGLWETEITAFDDFTHKTIDEDVVWETNWSLKGNLIIEAGNTLTIKEVVNMPPNSKIIVERGAQLIIDGGHITNGCGNLWQGIEVRGTYNQPQDYTYQGNVKIINGGTIENAVCGIQAIKVDEETGNLDQDYTGGMVWADGAVFRNCRLAAQFWPYDHSLGSSFFRNCEFITNNDLLPGTDPDYFIKTSGLSRLTVMGSSFTDSHTVMDFDELTSGIESYDTYLRTYSYIDQQCEFTGLYDGIRAYAHNPERTVLIKDGIFTNNMRSVYLATINDATVTGNIFHPLENEPPFTQEPIYCMYLDYCDGYTVEENEFIHYGSGTTGKGIVINNSGPNNNELYNNNFTNLEYATLAQNSNRGFSDDIGLKIKCNDYLANGNDIAVTATEGIKYPGIARHQGAEGGTEMQAGNRFSLNNNGNDHSDYSTFEEGPITYFHHDPGGEPRVKPEYISDYITLDQQGNPYDDELSCPSSSSGGGGIGRNELKGAIAVNGFKADSTQALLTALVDGGNSGVLEQEVLQSMPQETYDLYMSLMGKSPYLSDSVLMAAIEKESVLPNVLIKDILVANPQTAKSTEVMEKVDEKTNPFDEGLLAEVLLGKYIVAAKERLEANVAYYRHQRSTALKFLKQSYRNDTIDPLAHDSLVYLLENENGLNEKYELVFEYIGMGNWMAANDLLSSLSSKYSMDIQQQEIYQDAQQFTGVLFDLHQMDSVIYNMPETQINILYGLADITQNFIGSFARNILISTDGYGYIEPIILPGESLKSGNIVFDLPDLKTFKPQHVKIYPNPALDYIIIELNTGNVTGATVTLFDNQGKLLRSVNMPAHQQDYVLGLKDLHTGMYIIKVDCNGKNIGSKKFNIVK